jgi:hypothetical protein
METKNKTLQRMLFNKIIDKNIKTLKSSIALNDKNHRKKSKSKSKNNNSVKREQQISKKEKKEDHNLSRQKSINKMMCNKLMILRDGKNKRSKEKKVSTIDAERTHRKKYIFQKIMKLDKDEKASNKIKHTHAPLGRSTTFQVFKLREPKKIYNLNNKGLSNPLNNVGTIDTEMQQVSDDRDMQNKTSKENQISINFKNIVKEFKETQDDIDINTTSQETKYKSEKYLSVILFNIKKYKKLFLKYKKENGILKNENDELKKEIQDTKDELDIMKEEIEINKDNNKEIVQKFNDLTNYAKQNAINYEQKIFNLKQLLFSKDEEINKLNKIIDNKDAINMKIIEELKQKLFIQEQEIKNQQKIINEIKTNQQNSNN